MNTSGTALIIVGMTGDYLQPGRPGSETALAAIPTIERAIVAARSSRIPVIFSPRAYRHDGSNVEFMRRERFDSFRKAHGRWPMEEGSDGVVYSEGLVPEPYESVLVRSGFSAFFDTELAAWVAQHGIVRVVLAGANATMCVTATAFDALGHGQRVAFLPDGLGCTSPESLAAARTSLEHVIGLPALDVDPQRWANF